MKTRTKDLFDKLAKIEEEFFSGEQEFLCPVVGNQTTVVTKIASIEYRLKIDRRGRGNERLNGWHVFKATSPEYAVHVRPAELEEIEGYQGVFPKIRLILAHQSEHYWLGLPVGQDVHEAKMVPVHFAEGVELFDMVEAHYDGRQAWFVSFYDRADPMIAEQLRESFRDKTSNPNFPAITPDYKKAYAICRSILEELAKMEEKKRLEAVRATTKGRIELALNHGGASLQSYMENGSNLVVTWEFDGHVRQSTVRKDDLTVVTAGICLNGTDSQFDLAVLPSVFRDKLRRHNGFHDV